MAQLCVCVVQVDKEGVVEPVVAMVVDENNLGGHTQVATPARQPLVSLPLRQPPQPLLHDPLAAMHPACHSLAAAQEVTVHSHCQLPLALSLLHEQQRIGEERLMTMYTLHDQQRATEAALAAAAAGKLN